MLSKYHYKYVILLILFLILLFNASVAAASQAVQVKKNDVNSERATEFRDDQYIDDKVLNVLYKPHTISAFLVIFLIILYFGFFVDLPNPVDSSKLGVLVACIIFLIVGTLAFPNGPFTRPHPVFWRIVFGVSLLYEMLMIFILFQSKSNARHLFTYFDPSLGVPLAERSYASNCDLTWENVKNNLDRFVFAHFFGFVIKTMLVRSWVFAWVLSVLWELLEVVFKHQLPNFSECWWDQWILDVCLSNGLGIYVGYKLCQYLDMRPYIWGPDGEKPSPQVKKTLWYRFKRVALQFTPDPDRWTVVNWDWTKNVRRVVAFHFVLLFFCVGELNAFFLKFVLWLPPECNLNLFRLVIWTAAATPAIRQWYVYITDPQCKRLGTFTLLSFLILTTELLIVFKFGQNEFPTPMPFHIKTALWIAFAIWAIVVGSLTISVHQKQNKEEHEAKAKAKALSAKKQEENKTN